MIHCLDGRDEIRRPDLVQELLAMNYDESEVEAAIKGLHAGKLIQVSVGKYSTVTVR